MNANEIEVVSGNLYEVSTESDSPVGLDQSRFQVPCGECWFQTVVFRTKSDATRYLKSTLPEGVDPHCYAGARVRKFLGRYPILRDSDGKWHDLSPSLARGGSWEPSPSGYSDRDVITNS